MGCLRGCLGTGAVVGGLAICFLLYGAWTTQSASSWLVASLAAVNVAGFACLLALWLTRRKTENASIALAASILVILVSFHFGARWLISWNYTFVNPHYLTHAMKRNSQALLIYASDNNGALPRESEWMTASDGVYQASSRILEPFWANPEGGSIAFHIQLGGAELSAIDEPSQQVMLFDSTLIEENAHSDLSTLPKLRYADNESHRGWGPVFYFADAEGGVSLAAQSSFGLDGRPSPGAPQMREQESPPPDLQMKPADGLSASAGED
jgi:hypothetical protein